MRQHLPAMLCYASAVLGSPVVYSILFLMLIVIHWIDFTTHSWVMTQPSLGSVNKRRTPHSVTDTAIWLLHPSLQNMGIWMWPQNPSQHSDPGSNSQSPGIRIRGETYRSLSLFWSKALILQMQKLSLRRKKWFVQGHTARLWES